MGMLDLHTKSISLAGLLQALSEGTMVQFVGADLDKGTPSPSFLCSFVLSDHTPLF